MSYQRLDNFQNSLSVAEIESMRQKLSALISEMTLKKNFLHAHDYQNSMSHLQYVLNMYNGLLEVAKLESVNPYAKCRYNPYQVNQQVVYQPDGTTTTIIDERDIKSQATWKSQFDQQVLNPPSYTFPPLGVFDIQKLRSINI